MKTLIIFLTACLLGTVTVGAWPGAPATQAQVNGQTEPYKWVTPATLANRQINLIETNWISGQLYTNNYGVPITVTGNATLNLSGTASGVTTAALYVFGLPINGAATNTYSINRASPLGANLAEQSELMAVVPTNAVFAFTNQYVPGGDTIVWGYGQLKYP